MGDEGALCGRTYSAPRKWKRGKGRITVQMGCCYNYATDKQGRPPGILVDEPVNGLPPMLDDVVDRMVARRIFTGDAARLVHQTVRAAQLWRNFSQYGAIL